MGIIKKKEKVKLITAVTFNSSIKIQEICKILENKFGSIEENGGVFPFTFTDYYEEEMGKDLNKLFLAFKTLVDPEDLPDIKIETNNIEDRYLKHRNRNVNIDPGYISASKLVLATTKNYSHRLYLRDGIYGDIHLTFTDGKFHANPWTYPDYKVDKHIEYFENIRNDYLKQKREEKLVTYKTSGVNIDEAEKAVNLIKMHAKSTFGPNVLNELGKFGGFFKPDLEKYEEPVLVSSVDGVGTKIKIALMSGIHNTVGQDLVNHCVNDILSCGAKPLFFLDYIGTTNLKANVIVEIISGMATACKENSCALIGGEMAEMPGFYKPGDYDLVGSIVGIVDRNNILDGSKIQKGDKLIGLPSNGLHTNGFSLARKVFFDLKNYAVDEYIPELGKKLCDELLEVHRSYLNIVYPLIEKKYLHGIAHITGGGLKGNISRLLNSGLCLNFDWNSWEWLPVFKFIQDKGAIPDDEMKRVFNLGIGIVLIVSENKLDEILLNFENLKEDYILLGSLT
ncbi:phosphoribosylformylglycinamidine cyclo-ligase [candidate division KSB1 bacterium]